MIKGIKIIYSFQVIIRNKCIFRLYCRIAYKMEPNRLVVNQLIKAPVYICHFALL